MCDSDLSMNNNWKWIYDGMWLFYEQKILISILLTWLDAHKELYKMVFFLCNVQSNSNTASIVTSFGTANLLLDKW